MDEQHGRLSQCRQHLYRLHHAGVSRTNSCLSWMNRPARRVSSARTVGVYGQRAIRALQSFANDTVNKEPKLNHSRAGTGLLVGENVLRRKEEFAMSTTTVT